MIAGRGIEDPIAVSLGDSQAAAAKVYVPTADTPDAVTEYVLAMQPTFDLLRDGASQLASLLVLAAAGSKLFLGHPMVAVVEATCEEVREGVQAAPVCKGCEDHHRHLALATRFISQATDQFAALSARHDAGQLDDITRLLKCGCRHLVCASHALGGFEIVDLDQACCAEHAAAKMGVL